MTYHISLAQAPLGLSGQIDTEKKSRQNEVEVKDGQTGAGQYADTLGQRGNG